MSAVPGAPIVPGREVTGMAALLLPYTDEGDVDWQGFEACLTRTLSAGLVPAVNMDTGYAPLLEPEQRERVLAVAAGAGAPFVAGAHVPDAPGDRFDLDAYRRAFEDVGRSGGTPVVFPSFGLRALPDGEIVEAHRAMGRDSNGYYAFELGEMFAPAGRIYPIEVFRGLLEDPRCLGAKHSSLSRSLEWDRLSVRDAVRPDFRVLTGNDLAIDMVAYGSDYLLGLAAFAPDAFARRDAYWTGVDPRFWEVNDALQAVGSFAFRDPVPAYRHDAAMFLRLRGWIASDLTHPASPRRPDSDREVLRSLLGRLQAAEPGLDGADPV